MCGIFGYVGPRNTIDTCLAGLKNLQYRGYDSSGLAWVHPDSGLEVIKTVGPITALEQQLQGRRHLGSATIAHTRWATHGIVTQENAHPHCDQRCTLAVVHNGIIENYQTLLKELKEKGVHFSQHIDTTVVAELIAQEYEGDPLVAVAKAVRQCEGSYAFAILHRDHPNWMYLAVKDCPLVIGEGDNEFFVASDPNAFGAHASRITFLKSGEIAAVHSKGFAIYDRDLNPIPRTPQLFKVIQETLAKGGFSHYMMKEIHEQPQSLRDACFGRLSEQQKAITLSEVESLVQVHGVPDRVLFLGCGTAFHAGLMGCHWLEEVAQISAQAEIASEFRYRQACLPAKTWAIAVSQSGETADTLAALRKASEMGCPTLGIVNMPHSTLERSVDQVLHLRAGTEVAVCSTKAFTSQVGVIALLATKLAELKGKSSEELHRIKKGLIETPHHIQQVLDQLTEIEEQARVCMEYDRFMFLGRHSMVSAAMEGALKLKEIGYVEANAYPAGELKHGPIALIDSKCYTIALCQEGPMWTKLHSNLCEVRSRQGKILAIAPEGLEGIEQVADAVITVPRGELEWTPLLVNVVSQLLAYYVALYRGNQVDCPRNLAKSVTVE